ncbi:mCG1045747, partial [Mus musculus]
AGPAWGPWIDLCLFLLIPPIVDVLAWNSLFLDLREPWVSHHHLTWKCVDCKNKFFRKVS